MEVKSAALREGVCFLNSEEDFKDAKNFTLFIDKEALAKFKQAKIEDPAAHFKGQTVQVKGKGVLYRDRPEIKLRGPDGIKVVQKKEGTVPPNRTVHLTRALYGFLRFNGAPAAPAGEIGRSTGTILYSETPLRRSIEAWKNAARSLTRTSAALLAGTACPVAGGSSVPPETGQAGG
jgi:hypothetical protein